MSDLSYTSAALTDVGQVRKVNEDSILHMHDAGVFCVADGVGGGEAGEVASQMAVEHIQKEVEAQNLNGETRLDDLRDWVRKGLEGANHAIREYSEEHSLPMCASTSVVLAIAPAEPETALCLHIGDSRLYRIRERRLEPLTSDHSFEAGDGGHIPGSLPPIFKNMITRALGLKAEPDIEESRHDVAAGDILLVCSDGLSGYVSEDLILQIILESSNMEEGTTQLIAAANHAGGRDNISVILVQID